MNSGLATISTVKIIVITPAMAKANATNAGINPINKITPKNAMMPCSTGLTLLFSFIFFRKKDKQLAIDANSDAKELNSAAANLNKKGAVIITINKETKIIHDRLMHQVELAQPLFEKDYKAMSKEEKNTLGNIVRNTFSLAEMLNKKAEHI